MSRQYHNHLVRNTPNNRFTRWIVRLVVAWMTRSDSRWTLRLKYRRPRRGYKQGTHSIVRAERPPYGSDWAEWQGPEYARGSRFSVYLQERTGPAKKRREMEARRPVYDSVVDATKQAIREVTRSA